MSLERDRTALRKDGRDRGSLKRQTLLVKLIEKCETGISGGGRERAPKREEEEAQRGVGRAHEGERGGFMSNE